MRTAVSTYQSCSFCTGHVCRSSPCPWAGRRGNSVPLPHGTPSLTATPKCYTHLHTLGLLLIPSANPRSAEGWPPKGSFRLGKHGPHSEGRGLKGKVHLRDHWWSPTWCSNGEFGLGLRRKGFQGDGHPGLIFIAASLTAVSRPCAHWFTGRVP